MFCRFLALVLRKHLQSRLEAKGHKLEWADMVRDLDKPEETVLTQDSKQFLS